MRSSAAAKYIRKLLNISLNNLSPHRLMALCLLLAVKAGVFPGLTRRPSSPQSRRWEGRHGACPHGHQCQPLHGGPAAPTPPNARFSHRLSMEHPAGITNYRPLPIIDTGDVTCPPVTSHVLRSRLACGALRAVAARENGRRSFAWSLNAGRLRNMAEAVTAWL